MTKEVNKPGVYTHKNGGVIVAIDEGQARVCKREGFEYTGTVESWKKSQGAKQKEKNATEAEIVKK